MICRWDELVISAEGLVILRCDLLIYRVTLAIYLVMVPNRWPPTPSLCCHVPA